MVLTMATSFEITKIPIPSAKMNGEASVPVVCGSSPVRAAGTTAPTNMRGSTSSYGLVPTPFPYRMQENYSRELYDNEEDVIILENEYSPRDVFPSLRRKACISVRQGEGQGASLLQSRDTSLQPCDTKCMDVRRRRVELREFSVITFIPAIHCSVPRPSLTTARPFSASTNSSASAAQSCRWTSSSPRARASSTRE